MLALVPVARAQNDIELDPAITQEEFSKFSRLVAQGIYATPVDPARARGILGFDIGVAVTAIPVETGAAYWQHAVGNDFSVSDYVAVPKVIVSKGFGAGTLSASYSKVQSSDITVLGGALDIPIIDGGLVKPTLALRGVYSQLQGTDTYDLKTYGVELFLSKGIGPITPYAAIGRARSDAKGHGGGEGSGIPAFTLSDTGDTNRITLGVKLSLLLPKIVIEATQGEERSYSAKVSFGL